MEIPIWKDVSGDSVNYATGLLLRAMNARDAGMNNLASNINGGLQFLADRYQRIEDANKSANTQYLINTMNQTRSPEGRQALINMGYGDIGAMRGLMGYGGFNEKAVNDATAQWAIATNARAKAEDNAKLYTSEGQQSLQDLSVGIATNNRKLINAALQSGNLPMGVLTNGAGTAQSIYRADLAEKNYQTDRADRKQIYEDNKRQQEQEQQVRMQQMKDARDKEQQNTYAKVEENVQAELGKYGYTTLNDVITDLNSGSPSRANNARALLNSAPMKQGLQLGLFNPEQFIARGMGQQSLSNAGVTNSTPQATVSPQAKIPSLSRSGSMLNFTGQDIAINPTDSSIISAYGLGNKKNLPGYSKEQASAAKQFVDQLTPRERAEVKTRNQEYTRDWKEAMAYTFDKKYSPTTVGTTAIKASDIFKPSAVDSKTSSQIAQAIEYLNAGDREKGLAAIEKLLPSGSASSSGIFGNFKEDAKKIIADAYLATSNPYVLRRAFLYADKILKDTKGSWVGNSQSQAELLQVLGTLNQTSYDADKEAADTYSRMSNIDMSNHIAMAAINGSDDLLGADFKEYQQFKATQNQKQAQKNRALLVQGRDLNIPKTHKYPITDFGGAPGASSLLWRR